MIHFFNKRYTPQRALLQRGVSLIEIILVIAIIVILAAVAVPIQNTVLRSHAIASAKDDIQSALRSASLNAKLGSNGLEAGVYIGKNEANEPFIVLYRGESYEKRVTDLDTPVDVATTLNVTVAPEADIHFHIVSGAIDHDTIITIQNSDTTKVLHVNTAGTVNEEKAQ